MNDFVVMFMFLSESVIMIMRVSEVGAILCEYVNSESPSVNVC